MFSNKTRLNKIILIAIQLGLSSLSSAHSAEWLRFIRKIIKNGGQAKYAYEKLSYP